MKMSVSHKGEKNPFFGKRHTEETRRKMSEAKRGGKRGGSTAGGYRLIIAAIVRQAVKDGAAWFLESERGRSYCAAIGFNADNLHAGVQP
jgi:hypothetical protein